MRWEYLRRGTCDDPTLAMLGEEGWQLCAAIGTGLEVEHLFRRPGTDPLRAEVDRLRADVAHLNERWQTYEREYILPCFTWARGAGIDLERLVRESPGRNCVDLFVHELMTRTGAPSGVDVTPREALDVTLPKHRPGEAFVISQRTSEAVRVGDRVRVVAGHPQYAGLTGVVTEADRFFAGAPCIVMRDAEGDEGVWAVDSVERVEPRPNDATPCKYCDEGRCPAARTGLCPHHPRPTEAKPEPVSDAKPYACLACTTALPSHGMCSQCSKAWGFGRRDGLREGILACDAIAKTLEDQGGRKRSPNGRDDYEMASGAHRCSNALRALMTTGDGDARPGGPSKGEDPEPCGQDSVILELWVLSGLDQKRRAFWLTYDSRAEAEDQLIHERDQCGATALEVRRFVEAQCASDRPLEIGDTVRLRETGTITGWTGAATAPGARTADVERSGRRETIHEMHLVRVDGLATEMAGERGSDGD